MNRRQFVARLAAVVGAALCLKPAPLRAGDRIALPARYVVNAVTSASDGISIRFIRNYDIHTDQSPQRLDVWYGTAVIRPALAARVLG